ncbi:hypothetical protein [Azohydromonas aeria]|uniref:hypothetical protein n=1 Tax=Azohydromonas aeria TaxID=2590212 RepID=UPI0018E04DC4|nr:hypothetical protein [Azohydromonas aeria]
MPLETCPPAPALESLGLMEPGRAGEPFNGAGWAFALPLSGHRVLAAFGRGVRGDGVAAWPGCRLRSRRGVEAARWFPEVARALAALRRRAPTVADGEICVLDPDGRSNPALLHERSLVPGRRPGTPPAVLVLRDLLVWEGRDVRSLPWSARRRLLAGLPRQEPPRAALRLQRCVDGEGLWLARQAQALGHAAIDAFRHDAPYVAGPGIGWLSVPVAGHALDAPALGLAA